MKKLVATIVLSLVLAFVTLPARPVLAVPVVSVSPDRGQPGSRVYITGSGFTPNIAFYVYFARGTSYESARSGTVSASGTIYDTFPVPEVPAGTYTVAAETTLLETGFSSYIVVPGLTLNKTSAYVGTVVIANGVGFKSSSAISLDFDNTAVGNTNSGTNGSFSGVSFTLPDGVKGNHLITGTDSIYNTAISTITILQSVSISPDSGATGTSVNVKGTGFQGNQAMVITFDGAGVSTNPATVITSAGGSFSATFTVPASSKRVHDIVFSDGANTASASFTSVGTINITPTSGDVGTQVTVKGSGFAGGKSITIKVDAAQVATTTVDTSGSFTATFSLPATPSGTHTITASDGMDSAIARFATSATASINPTKGAVGSEVSVTGSGLAASRPVNITFGNTQVKSAATDANGGLNDRFNVPKVPSGNYPISISDGENTVKSSFSVVASASLNQTGGNIGSSLTVSGSGFSGAVTVKYDNIVVATTGADASGAFFVTFSVPVSVHGNHAITISDSTSSVQSNFAVESTPPQSPALVLPTKDSDAKELLKYDWSDVTDPSMPVTYILQVATSRDFTTASIVLERKGLTVSEYTPTKEEQLKPAKKDAPYYWRVRAIDSASNESDWSPVSSFYISAFPDWVKYALIGFGALVVALLIFWLGRRTKRTI